MKLEYSKKSMPPKKKQFWNLLAWGYQMPSELEFSKKKVPYPNVHCTQCLTNHLEKCCSAAKNLHLFTSWGDIFIFLNNMTQSKIMVTLQSENVFYKSFSQWKKNYSSLHNYNSTKNADFREINCPPFFFVKLQHSVSTLITNIFQNFFRLNWWEGRRFHKIMELKMSDLLNNMSKK